MLVEIRGLSSAGWNSEFALATEVVLEAADAVLIPPLGSDLLSYCFL